MKKIIFKIYKNTNKKLYLSLILFLMLFACLDGTGDLPNSVSVNPFGAQIIFPNANPDLIFGNLCDLTELEVIVNRELTPNGSLVQYELNSTTLPLSKRGNIVSFTGTIVDGRSFAQYLAGLVRLGDEVFSIESITLVNIGVTITPLAGDPQSDFATVFINPISIAAVEESLDVEANPDPQFCTDQGLTPNLPVTVTVQFDTIGIPTTPNTGSLTQAAVDILVSNPLIGSVNDPTPPIVGTVNNGLITVQYTAIDNTSGTQVITAVITLPDPADKFPELPSIPLSERQLTAQIFINQTVGTACFEDSGGGGVGADTITLSPPTNQTGTPSTVNLQTNVKNSEGTNIQGRQVCCEFLTNTNPQSSIMAVGSVNECANTDINGNAFFDVFIVGGIPIQQQATISCCSIPDGSGPPCPVNALASTATITVNP